MQPGAATRLADGDTTYGPATPHPRWCRREEVGGTEGVQSDLQLTERRVRYTIRWLTGLDTSWWVEDEGGGEYRIESVIESPVGRRQFQTIDCTARA